MEYTEIAKSPGKLYACENQLYIQHSITKGVSYLKCINEDCTATAKVIVCMTFDHIISTTTRTLKLKGYRYLRDVANEQQVHQPILCVLFLMKRLVLHLRQ